VVSPGELVLKETYGGLCCGKALLLHAISIGARPKRDTLLANRLNGALAGGAKREDTMALH
jgi:hypothetical protein